MSSLPSAACSRRRPWRRWPSVSARTGRRRGRRLRRARVRPRSRCRLRSAGCGSSTAWKGPSATYTIPLARAADRRARPRGAGGGAGRRGGAAREPAHDLPGHARGAAPGDPGRGRGTAASGGDDGQRGRACPRRSRKAAQRGFDLARRAAAAGASVRARRRTSTCCCCCCITLPATAGRWRRWRAILRAAYAARCNGRTPELAGLAGAICRLHAVAARGSRVGGAIRESAIARQLAFWTRRAQGPSRSDRSAERPAAAGGGEPSRRQRRRSR